MRKFVGLAAVCAALGIGAGGAAFYPDSLVKSAIAMASDSDSLHGVSQAGDQAGLLGGRSVRMWLCPLLGSLPTNSGSVIRFEWLCRPE
jgi:hypothetical protein